MYYQLLLFAKSMREHFKEQNTSRLLITVVVILLVGVTALYGAEAKVNSSINNFWDALWWGVVTMTTVGYGDIFPVTQLGRIIGVLVMILGIGTLAGVIGVFASAIQTINLKKEMGKLTAIFKDHVIICGWTEKAKHIIDELHSQNVKGDHPVVLIADIETNPVHNDNLVHFVKGRIDSDQALKKAKIEDARSVIVLNEDGEDSTTVLACLTAEKLNPSVYTVAEVTHAENRIHFERAKVDEIIVSSELNSRLLVRSALHSGIASIVEELTTAAHGNEIYTMDIKKRWIGKTFKELHDIFYEQDAMLIGYKEGQEVFTNPKKETVVKQEYQLVYIAEWDIENKFK